MFRFFRTQYFLLLSCSTTENCLTAFSCVAKRIFIAMFFHAVERWNVFFNVDKIPSGKWFGSLHRTSTKRKYTQKESNQPAVYDKPIKCKGK